MKGALTVATRAAMPKAMAMTELLLRDQTGSGVVLGVRSRLEIWAEASVPDCGLAKLEERRTQYRLSSLLLVDLVAV